MVMLKAVLPYVPIVAVLAAAIARHLLLVRLLAIAVVFLCVLLSSGALIAPHRIAEELVHQSPQSAEWQRGARDTRDAVYGVLPLLGASFLALVVMAVLPLRRKPTI
jgi:hypothetical protein